jgi:SAM-dependent methyltransferase
MQEISMIQCNACGCFNINRLIPDQKFVYSSTYKTTIYHFDLLECKNCGMAFIHPLPSEEEMQYFYEDYGVYNSFKEYPTLIKFPFARMRFSASLYEKFVGVLAEWFTGRSVPFTLGIPLQYPKVAAIMDLGYGSGEWLLNMAALGYQNLHGYDIEANRENRSKLEKAGISVYSGEFVENKFSFSFDCIRLNHVFEHLLQPLSVLRKCHHLLKPGGKLVMHFPCKQSLSFKLSPTNWAALDIPKHLYQYTWQSAEIFLKEAGFITYEIKYVPSLLVMLGTINNIIQNYNKKLPKIHKAFGILIEPLYRLLCSALRLGENLSICAVK